MAEHQLTQADVFLLQAEQTAPRSPFYSELCRRLADDERVSELIEDPPRWDAPLRLLAGLHYLVLGGEAQWESIDQNLTTHREVLRRFVAEVPIQTNEVQRCWMLLPCFLYIAHETGAETFDLIELGPSAGLNLGWDRYRYTYAAGGWGPTDAELTLTGEERGRVSEHLLGKVPRVRSRIGIELNPIDVSTEDGARRLRSFVWPDQIWRMELLERAIATLRREPPVLLHGDVADVLPEVLQTRAPGGLTLVWQTAVLGYLPADRRRRVYEALAKAGSEAPLAFAQTTVPEDGSIHYYGLSVQLWPGGSRRVVAHADFHGAWLDWFS